MLVFADVFRTKKEKSLPSKKEDLYRDQYRNWDEFLREEYLLIFVEEVFREQEEEYERQSFLLIDPETVP